MTPKRPQDPKKECSEIWSGSKLGRVISHVSRPHGQLSLLTSDGRTSTAGKSSMNGVNFQTIYIVVIIALLSSNMQANKALKTCRFKMTSSRQRLKRVSCYPLRSSLSLSLSLSLFFPSILNNLTQTQQEKEMQ